MPKIIKLSDFKRTKLAEHQLRLRDKGAQKLDEGDYLKSLLERLKNKPSRER